MTLTAAPNPIAPAGPKANRSSFPIDFSLYDDNYHYVLYIADDHTEEHRLIVDLENTSGQDIWLGPLDDPNAHFELRFRKGALSDKTLDLLRGNVPNPDPGALIAKEDANDWTIKLAEDSSGAQAYISLFLRRKTPILVSAGHTLLLTLQNISADAGTGTRGTRVEFIPRQITYNDDAKTPITGSREQQLYITNHSGEKVIPLHVGFVGSNRILNDGGARNSLTLRITNIARDNRSILFTPTKADTPTFIIDSDYDVDWGLGTKSQVAAISLIPPAPWKIERDAQSLIWKIYVEDTLQALDPDQYIEFTLDNITSSEPAGFTQLQLNYYNVQGYWPGSFSLAIEKTPLLFSADNNVGIGVPNPANRLTVQTATDAPALMVKQTGAGGAASLSSAADAAESPTLTVYQNGAGGAANLTSGKPGTASQTPTLVVQQNGPATAAYLSSTMNGPAAATLIVSQSGAGGAAYLVSTTDAPATPTLMVSQKGAGGAAILTSGIPTTRTPTLVVQQYGPATAAFLSSTADASDSPTLYANQAGPGRAALFLSPGDSSPTVQIRNTGMGSAIQLESKGSTAPTLSVSQKGTGLAADLQGNVSIQGGVHIMNTPQDANGTPFVLGNIRLGYDQTYVWIQSHGQQPLAINPIGNNVGIGTTAPVVPLHIKGGPVTQFPTTSTQVFGLYVEENAAAKWWHTTSDARVKTELAPVDPLRSLGVILNLILHEYEYRPEFDAAGQGKKYHGFLAQEVEKVMPSAVAAIGEQTLRNGEVLQNFRVVANDQIFNEAVGAIQALHEIIRRQEERIAALENQG